MEDLSLDALSDKIDRLVDQCKQMEQEIKDLRDAKQRWSLERVQLVRKNDLACEKIKLMLEKLKSEERQS